MKAQIISILKNKLEIVDNTDMFPENKPVITNIEEAADRIVNLFATYSVSGSSAFTKEDLKKAYNNGTKQGSVNGMRVARGGEMNLRTFDEWYDEHYL